MSVALNTGSRLPAYCTSLGRVMLAHLPDDELKRYLETVKLRAYTDRTVVSSKRLKEILLEVREAGFAIIDEELEIGLRSIAVPVRGASGNVVAALNVGVQSIRVSKRQMQAEILPVLLKGSEELSILLP